MKKWIEAMTEQHEENEKYLELINRELKHAPEGSLRRSYYRGHTRFYHSVPNENKKVEYLGKDQTFLLDALAQKKYNLKAYAALMQEQRVIESVLAKDFPTLTEIFEALPQDVQKHVEPHVLPDDEYAERWVKEMSLGASGEKFKSRVEVILHQYYKQHHIPNVYEPALYLDGFGTVRPDFAVLNMRTRQMFYHEHFGKLDDEEYRLRNMKKLRAYHKNGFYEGVNLIVTMESDGVMVDYEELEELVLKYLT